MRAYIRPFGAAVTILAMALCLMALPTLGQSKDPSAGTWVEDLSKTTFTPYVAFQSRTITISYTPGGEFQFVRDSKNGFMGGVDETSFTAKFDGKDYPIEEAELDTVSLKRIDKDTIERTGKIRGKVAETAIMKISPNGKVLTITTKGMIGTETYSSEQILDRQ